MAIIGELILTSGAPIHKGDKKRISSTATDDNDVAAEPTQVKIEIIPPSGSSNKTIYAKTPGAGEVQAIQSGTGVWYGDHIFDEAGWWNITTTGSGNMDEVDYQRLFVHDVPS